MSKFLLLLPAIFLANLFYLGKRKTIESKKKDKIGHSFWWKRFGFTFLFFV